MYFGLRLKFYFEEALDLGRLGLAPVPLALQLECALVLATLDPVFDLVGSEFEPAAFDLAGPVPVVAGLGPAQVVSVAPMELGSR